MSDKTICDRCEKEVSRKGIWAHRQYSTECRKIAKAEADAYAAEDHFMGHEAAWNSAIEEQEGADDDYFAG